MKSLITLCLSLFACFGITHAQTVIYSQNFNSGSASDWSLNTTDLGGDNSMSDNQWVINNIYAGGILAGATASEPAAIAGYPHSYYMHIYSAAGTSLGQPANDNFDAVGGSTFFAAMTTPQVTTGYTNVYFSFWWLCNGDASSIGNVYYRTSSGGAWIQITAPITNFYGSSVWANDSFHLAAFDNQAFLEFGFQFTDGGTGNDPAFGIDDISITAPGSVTAPVASFTAPATTTCQDSCITFTSTSTGTITSINWTAPGATVGSASITPTSICFPSAGTYTVTLYAYNSTAVDSFSKVITINPTPHPAITQSGNVLSVAPAYTSYQWYNGLSPIVGANTNTYTITATSTYGIVVDSAGCPGFDSLTATTLHVANINNSSSHYWIAQPNNSSLSINSSKPLNDALAITIYDATGRKILDETWDPGSYTKEINSLAITNGLYIIKLSNTYTSAVFKWLKQ